MGNRLTFLARLALAVLLALLMPLAAFGGKYKIKKIEVSWSEAAKMRQNRTYGYEMRVAQGRPGESYTEVGAFRRWEKGDYPPAVKGYDPYVEIKYQPFGAFTLPLEYSSGDALQLRWYDHVMAAVRLTASNIKDPRGWGLYYPAKGEVTVMGSNGSVLAKEEFFNDEQNGTPLNIVDNEVRIPWRNAQAKVNAHQALYTVLRSDNGGDNTTASFSLPDDDPAGDGITISLTITMKRKEVREGIKYVPNAKGQSFDGSARIRLKSPGDVGFVENLPFDGKDFWGNTVPYFNAYPYPDNKYTKGKLFVEGLMLVVEKRNVAKDGVCVGRTNGGTLVKIRPESVWDGTKTTNDKALPAESTFDRFGTNPNDEYWIVPLWSESGSIEVMPGPCPGESLRVEYVADGADHTLALYSDENCISAVQSGDEVESGHQVYAKITPKGSQSECKQQGVYWNVNGNPPDGESATLGSNGVYSFIPRGAKNSVVKVWVKTVTKQTKITYDDKHYTVVAASSAVGSGAAVECGTEVTVNRKGDRGCVESVAVKRNGDPVGTIEWDGAQGQWKPVKVAVKGDEAKLTFEETSRRYSIKWTLGAGYTLTVTTDGGQQISNGGEVACGGAVTITAEPNIQGQRVRNIIAKSGANPISGSLNGNQLTIGSLQEDITEIEVELGPDPNGLTVVVDEDFEGDRVARIEVTNLTKSMVIWDGTQLADGGRFEEGDEIKVYFADVIDPCKTDVTVAVEERVGANGNLLKMLNKGDYYLINQAHNGINVRVASANKKKYTVTWATGTALNFEVMQNLQRLSSGSSVECESTIEIVPKVGECLEVASVLVNATNAVPKDADGKYTYAVSGEVTSIEVETKPKMLMVTWDQQALNCKVSVGGNEQSPVGVTCGAKLSVTITPRAGEGAVQSVTIKEGNASVELSAGQHTGYEWGVDQESVTIAWIPKADVQIESVGLPEKYKIDIIYPIGDCSVEVVPKTGGAPITSGATLAGGTELTVKVTVTEPARWELESLTVDGAKVNANNTLPYTYEFKLTKDVKIEVRLQIRQYPVEYTATQSGVEDLEVWRGAMGANTGGIKISSGTLVAYGTKLYVQALPKAGTAVIGVARVEAKYKNVNQPVPLTPEGDGWFSLAAVEGAIEAIVVTVEKLQPGEVFVVYSGDAIGAEDLDPYGVKGKVQWLCKGTPLMPKEKSKVNVSDKFTWKLSAAAAVGSGGYLRPICLAANQQYALRLEPTDRTREFATLRDLLPKELREKVDRQEVTTLRLDTYISMSLASQKFLVLQVRDPEPLGRLSVRVDGASAALIPNQQYRVSGGTRVNVQARPNSSASLVQVRIGSKEFAPENTDFEYTLPVYEEGKDNRVIISAQFTNNADDECLLNLVVNDPAGGNLTARHGADLLESGQKYQRGMGVQVTAQANPGYYLRSLRRGGLDVYSNEDTTKGTYTFELSLPAREVVLEAVFEKNSAGKGVKDAVESLIWRDVVLYPNPTAGDVEVRGAGVVVRYEVYDVTGREMLRGVHDGGAQLRIGLQPLSAGYYIVRLYSYDGDATSRGVLRR